jgi:hypothetical protein
MRTVKKSKMYLLIAREREEITQKFQRIWIQQAKTIYYMQKFLKNYGALLTLSLAAV